MLNSSKTKNLPLFIWYLLGTVAFTGIVFMFWPQKIESIRFREKRNITINKAVNEYIAWSRNSQSRRMEIHHQYSRQGMVKLADALTVMVRSMPRVTRSRLLEDIELIRTKSVIITQEPTSSKHADILKHTFGTSAIILKELQARKYPHLKEEIDTLNLRIRAIKPKQPALHQEKQILDVFQYLSVVLGRMIKG